MSKRLRTEPPVERTPKEICECIHNSFVPEVRKMVARLTAKYLDKNRTPVHGYEQTDIVLACIKAAVNALQGDPCYRVTIDKVIPKHRTSSELLMSLRCPESFGGEEEAECEGEIEAADEDDEEDQLVGDIADRVNAA